MDHSVNNVIWFVNIRLSDDLMSSSGTWIAGMSDSLRTFYPELSVTIVCQGPVRKVIKETARGRVQYIMPFGKECKSSTINLVKEIITTTNPQLIQIWGTEQNWGLIPFGLICPQVPVLLEMQGVCKTVADGHFADLTIIEKLSCFKLREFLKPKESIWARKLKMEKQSLNEYKMLSSSKNISVQSKWVENYVKFVNPRCRIFETKIALRKEFYIAKKWEYENANKNVIFSMPLSLLPMKGALTLLKAFNEVIRVIPDAQLNLGGLMRTGWKAPGYYKYLVRYIEEHSMKSNIHFLGTLNTVELCEQLRRASVFVHPSFVESYSLSLAEAMMIGTPSIATYSGAMPELGVNDSVLYFPKGDYVALAGDIISVLKSRELACGLSDRARAIASQRHDSSDVASTQYYIYNDILKKEEKLK